MIILEVLKKDAIIHNHSEKNKQFVLGIILFYFNFFFLLFWQGLMTCAFSHASTQTIIPVFATNAATAVAIPMTGSGL